MPPLTPPHLPHSNQVLHFSHILLFGDPEAGAPSELSFGPEVKHLQLEDGCAGDEAQTECAAFKVLSLLRPATV